MAQSPKGVDVPTQEEFDDLKAQVEDLDARVTALEQGSPEPIMPSPDGTQVTDTNGQIIDGEGNEFKLVTSVAQGLRISMNDGAPTGANVLRLYADEQMCYQENSDHDWWRWEDNDWQSTTDPTGEQPPNPQPGTLFADEFNSGLSLWNSYAPDNTKVWQLSRWYGNDWNGWKCNDGWMVNPWNPNTPWTDFYKLDGNGALALGVGKTPPDKVNQLGGCHYLTAQVNSLNFAKLGGYWEARIKCPNIRGTNMAFWLMNKKSWPPEVDILEMVNHGDWVLMSQNLWHVDQKTEPYYLFTPNFDPTAWHTYGFYWDTNAGKMTYYFDGHITMQPNVPSGYTEPMFVILGSQQGGDWSGPIPDGAQLGPLLVDYVRCYDHPPQTLANAAPAPAVSAPRNVSLAQLATDRLNDRKARMTK